MPGKLSLCVGLPILLKKNQAVELGITNGAEATVVGWKSREFIKGVKTVDVVFAQLMSPGLATQIPGLPPNIVPIQAETMSITVVCPDDSKLSISRTQVPILPNFAMTDYACQGRTRPFNVIDLKDCKTHQSAYVMLSRGQSLSRLCIIQDFDPMCLSSGTTRSLLHEFRDLEILNDITKMRLHGTLPSSIEGAVKNDLIQAYQRHFGHSHKPESTDEYLRWPSHASGDIFEDLSSRIFISKSARKRQRSLSFTIPNKKTPTIAIYGNGLLDTPQPTSQGVFKGASWQNNSCAYDCLTTALFLLKQARDVRQDMYGIWNASQYTQALDINGDGDAFNISRLNSLRDNFRRELRQIDNELRADLVSVFRVANHLFPVRHTSRPYCLSCGSEIWNTLSCDSFITSKISISLSETENTIQTCIQALLDSRLCDRCEYPATKGDIVFEVARTVLPVEIHCQCPLWDTIEINEDMELTLTPTEVWKYSLAAVIYLGSGHFTAKYRTVTRDDEYDGLRQMGAVVTSVKDSWKMHGHRKAACLIYILIDKTLK